MLDGLFDARRVAVVGVSPSEKNHGRRIVLHMHDFGYDGELFLIGRSGGEVGGRPILGSLDEIPGEIDLAILLVPLRLVSATLEECGRKGARWVILQTGGFSEYGVERAAAEEEVRAILRRHAPRRPQLPWGDQYGQWTGRAFRTSGTRTVPSRTGQRRCPKRWRCDVHGRNRGRLRAGT